MRNRQPSKMLCSGSHIEVMDQNEAEKGIKNLRTKEIKEVIERNGNVCWGSTTRYVLDCL